MIPTLIVFGLAFGRWWRSALAIAALGWPTVLVATGVSGVEPSLLAAGGLAIVNAGLGVLVHQGILRVSRRLATRARSRQATRRILSGLSH